jgi:hypothetical protein
VENLTSELIAVAQDAYLSGFDGCCNSRCLVRALEERALLIFEESASGGYWYLEADWSESVEALNDRGCGIGDYWGGGPTFNFNSKDDSTGDGPIPGMTFGGGDGQKERMLQLFQLRHPICA